MQRVRDTLTLDRKLGEAADAAPKTELAQRVAASSGPSRRTKALDKEIAELTRAFTRAVRSLSRDHSLLYG